MKRKISNLRAAAVAITMLALFAQFPVSAQRSGDEASGNERTLEGSWSSTVTIRVCQTGTALFTFPAIQTYMHGGTMQDSAADSKRTSGHGVWRRQSGRNYSAAFQFFNFDAAGNPVGKTRVNLQNTLSRNGNNFATTATVEVFDNGGNIVATACATGESTRFN